MLLRNGCKSSDPIGAVPRVSGPPFLAVLISTTSFSPEPQATVVDWAMWLSDSRHLRLGG